LATINEAKLMINENNDSLQSKTRPGVVPDGIPVKVLITLDHDGKDCWVNGYLCYRHTCRKCPTYTMSEYYDGHPLQKMFAL
jgi:hypothetical protein